MIVDAVYMYVFISCSPAVKIDGSYDLDYAEILLFRARPSTAKIAISPPYLTQNKNNE